MPRCESLTIHEARGRRLQGIKCIRRCAIEFIFPNPNETTKKWYNNNIRHHHLPSIYVSAGNQRGQTEKERIDNEKDDGAMSRAWSDALRTSPSSSSSSSSSLPSHSMILRPLSIHYFDREMISESSARTLSVTHRGFYLYYVYLSIDIYILIYMLYIIYFFSSSFPFLLRTVQHSSLII